MGPAASCRRATGRVVMLVPSTLVDCSKQATVAREQACDETVLALGTRPSVYARAARSRRVCHDTACRLRGAAYGGPIVSGDQSHDDPQRRRSPDGQARRVAVPRVSVLTLSVAAAQQVLRQRSASTESAPAVPAHARQPTVRRQPRHVHPLTDATLTPTTSTALPQERALDSACAWEEPAPSSSLSMSDSGRRSVIHEQVGSRGTDRVIQRSFGDFRPSLPRAWASRRVVADQVSG